MVGSNDSCGDGLICISCCIRRISGWNWAELLRLARPVTGSARRRAVLGRGDDSGVSPSRGVNGVCQMEGSVGRLAPLSLKFGREALGCWICCNRSRAVTLGGCVSGCDIFLPAYNCCPTVFRVGVGGPGSTPAELL